MIPTPVFVANWKMHHDPRAAREYVARFIQRFSPHPDRTVILCPPAIAIETTAAALATRTDIALGVQNIWTEPKGAFTGETSAPMARGAGARFALIGHSERRHVFGETNAQTASKCVAAVGAGLTPVLCVGETIDQRESGRTAEVVLEQLRVGISELAPDTLSTMVFAYEPVWAIGTGKTATPTDATEVHRVIRAELETRIATNARNVPILYGGSVSETNAESLLAASGVSGLLVGGASLEPDRWAAICSTAVTRE